MDCGFLDRSRGEWMDGKVLRSECWIDEDLIWVNKELGWSIVPVKGTGQGWHCVDFGAVEGLYRSLLVQSRNRRKGFVFVERST